MVELLRPVAGLGERAVAVGGGEPRLDLVAYLTNGWRVSRAQRSLSAVCSAKQAWIGPHPRLICGTWCAVTGGVSAHQCASKVNPCQQGGGLRPWYTCLHDRPGKK